jgi:hypothetical protein
MMAVHWYAERRARLETRLIERYHTGLLAHGVTWLRSRSPAGRLSTLGHRAAGDPGVAAVVGLPPLVWRPHLHRILAAFEDLDCAALL